MKNKQLQGALVLVVVLSPKIVCGLGIRIADQDPLATARGNAFVATADNPSAIYYNPAGISQLEGQNIRAGFYGIYLNSDYDSPTASAEFETKDKLAGVPQFYFTCSPKDCPLSFGLGLYSPYGLSLEWPDHVPFRTIGTYGRITYLTIHPVVSWKITDNLFLAAGPTFNYGDTELRQGVAPAAFGFGDLLTFKGDDWDYGFTAGLLWKISGQHSIGINYRSATTLNFKGTLHGVNVPSLPPAFSQPANASFAFPQNVVFGYSFRPTKDWNFEINVDWTDWDRLKAVNLNSPSPFPLSQSKNFDWRSSFFYEFGVTRYFGGGCRLSGGYIYSENSVPDSAFNPLIPDSDRHIFSIGIGRKYPNSRWSWDFAYQFAYGPERTVNNQPAVAHPENGSYEFISHALSLSLGYSF